MADREKVIENLERMLSNYDMLDDIVINKNNEMLMFHRAVAKAALSLLKEQEAKEGHWIVLEFCANEGIYCSECHMKIFDRTTKPKEKLSQYCPHCGSRNEQFFRDGEVVFR